MRHDVYRVRHTGISHCSVTCCQDVPDRSSNDSVRKRIDNLNRDRGKGSFLEYNLRFDILDFNDKID